MFDKDNLYPQRMKLFREGSGTCDGCVETKAKHIRGFGFVEDFDIAVRPDGVREYKRKPKTETIDGKSVNSRGESFRMIKRQMTRSVAGNRGFALHLNYNALMEISEISFIPWEYCRLGVSDSYQFSNKIHIWENWEMILNRQNMKMEPQVVDTFNPDPDVVASQVERAGGLDKYGGQLLYWTEEGLNKYVLASFDAVLDHVRAEGSVGAYNANSAENNFTASTFMGFPQQATEDGEKAILRKIREFQGPENAQSILAIFGVEEGFQPMIQSLEQQDFDGRLKITGDMAKAAIMEKFGQTPALKGVPTPGKLGSSEEISNAFELYNTHTQEERDDFSGILQTINEYASPNIKLSESGNFDIIPLTFANSNQNTNAESRSGANE